MKKRPKFQEGQRWEYSDAIPEFENCCVIARIIEPRPEFGWHNRECTVYVRYSKAAKASIPENEDGVVLTLTDEGMSRSVTRLREVGVRLPWWWKYGRRYKSKKDAPNGSGSLCTESVGKDLSHVYRGAVQRAQYIRMARQTLEQHKERIAANRSERRPSASVAESWRRIKNWYGAHAEPIDQLLACGATDAKIQRFEKAIGASMPEDFKESVRIHDGGGWWVPHCHGDLQSLDEILKQWTMYGEWQASGTYAVDNWDWTPSDLTGPIKPVFWNKRRIHVTENSGDHLTLDLDPPPEGTYGQVLDHSHEVGPLCVLAPGWGAFLAQLVEDLESGRYVYLRDSGVLLAEQIERNIR